MSEPKQPKPRISQKTALLLAGLASSVAVFVLLSDNSVLPNLAKESRSAVQSTLKQAKKLQRAGKWKKSAELLQPYVMARDPIALLEYGKMLARGWGMRRDLAKARENLLLAVQFEFSKRGQAAFELANVYRQSPGEDCSRIAFEWFTKSASWGFLKAHAELGRHHARGIGVPVNFPQALKEYQMAARNGSAKALLSFLTLVSKKPSLGKDLPPREELLVRAISHLEKEAMSGKPASAKALGRLYLGKGVMARNTKKAKLWFQRGADLGDGGAMYELAKLMLEDSPTEKEIEKSFEWMRLAISQNNAGAITEFGRLHLEERFGLQKKDAVSLFERGIGAAHPGSMKEMAMLQLVGDLVPKDEASAKKLLKRGAALGHKGSTRLLREVLAGKTFTKSGSSAAEGKPSSGKKTKTKKLKHPPTGATVITPFGRKG